MAHGRKTGGRVAGTPNKATTSAREAIGQVLEAKVHNLADWVDSTANGIKQVKVAADGTQYEEYVVKPNPAKAFELMQSLLEFSVPKLTRVQVAGDEHDQALFDTNMGVFTEILEAVKAKRQAEQMFDGASPPRRQR